MYFTVLLTSSILDLRNTEVLGTGLEKETLGVFGQSKQVAAATRRAVIPRPR
jgi:hypothetical protein